MSPEELAREFGIGVQRLADLRSQGKGPPYFKFGGIWYPKGGFDLWVEKSMEGEEFDTKKEERQLALPVRVQGTRILGEHRFGRHTTKQDGSARDRSGGTEGSQAGKAGLRSSAFAMRCPGFCLGPRCTTAPIPTAISASRPALPVRLSS
jgi:hypothetical protein